VNESLPGRIFISYRRQETAWPAGRLYDVLVENFPADEVFKDVDNIDSGEDFTERITAAVGSCDVLLALIGPRWLTITDKKGQRRIDDPEDYVRLEIETALTRKIRVIPILVDEARMPGVDELPATLAPLIGRNAVEINHITFQTKRLIATVQKTLAELKASDTTTGSAAATSTARPDGSAEQVAGPDKEQLYDQALAAFWTEPWDEAVDLLGQVLTRHPDDADAARVLELARHQQQLASHYAQASAAGDAGDREQAVAEYTTEALERVNRLDSTYQNAPALLNRARQELAQTADPARRQVGELIRRQAEARNAPDSSAAGVQRPPDQRELTGESRAASNGRQRYSAPSQEHPQGTMILIFGSLGMLIPILAPIAWYLGNKANNEIQSSGIHYTNEGNISAGRMLGKIFTIIAASVIVLWIVIAAMEAIQGG
jgi:hypothetical protein